MADLPPTEPWIEAITRPIEETPELCLAARQYLSSLADRDDPEGLTRIGVRFRSLDSAPPKLRSARSWIRRFVATLAFGLSHRVDPDNASFILLAAAEKAEGTYKHRRSRTNPKSVLITKPAEFQEALALIHQAASLTRFVSYHEDLFLQRLAMLPPARDVHSRLSRMSFAELKAGPGASAY